MIPVSAHHQGSTGQAPGQTPPSGQAPESRLVDWLMAWGNHSIPRANSEPARPEPASAGARGTTSTARVRPRNRAGHSRPVPHPPEPATPGCSEEGQPHRRFPHPVPQRSSPTAAEQPPQPHRSRRRTTRSPEQLHASRPGLGPFTVASPGQHHSGRPGVGHGERTPSAAPALQIVARPRS